jgi:hypothetical protein
VTDGLVSVRRSVDDVSRSSDDQARLTSGPAANQGVPHAAVYGPQQSIGPNPEDTERRGRKGGRVARKGDLIVVNPRRVGESAREAEILEVIEGDLRVRYRIRWNDGHESVFAPAAGAARIEPARDRKKAGSEPTKPKKSPARASTATKSAAAKAVREDHHD